MATEKLILILWIIRTEGKCVSYSYYLFTNGNRFLLAYTCNFLIIDIYLLYYLIFIIGLTMELFIDTSYLKLHFFLYSQKLGTWCRTCRYCWICTSLLSLRFIFITVTVTLIGNIQPTPQSRMWLILYLNGSRRYVSNFFITKKSPRLCAFFLVNRSESGQIDKDGSLALVAIVGIRNSD